MGPRSQHSHETRGSALKERYSGAPQVSIARLGPAAPGTKSWTSLKSSCAYPRARGPRADNLGGSRPHDPHGPRVRLATSRRRWPRGRRRSGPSWTAAGGGRSAWCRTHHSRRRSPSRGRRHRVRRQRDDRNVLGRGVLLEPPRRLPAVEVGQAQVHQHEVRELALSHGDALLTIRHDQHLEAFSTQPPGQHVAAKLRCPRRSRSGHAWARLPCRCRKFQDSPGSRAAILRVFCANDNRSATAAAPRRAAAPDPSGTPGLTGGAPRPRCGARDPRPPACAGGPESGPPGLGRRRVRIGVRQHRDGAPGGRDGRRARSSRIRRWAR